MLDIFVTLAAILFIAVLGVTLYRLYINRPGANGTPPGPIGLPFIGYAPFLGKYPWIGLDKLRSKYPHLISLYLGKDYTVVLQDYDAYKAAYLEQDEAFVGRPDAFLTNKFSEGKDGRIHGIMALEGPKALDTHVFATNMFQELGVDTPRLDNIMIDQVNNCIDAFGKQTGPFEPGKYIYAAKVNVMSAIIFGRTLEYLGPEFTALTKEVFRMLDAVGGGIIQQYPILRYIPGPPKAGWDAATYTFRQGFGVFERELDEHERTYQVGVLRDFIDGYLRRSKNEDGFNNLAMQNRDDLITTAFALWTAGPEATSVTQLWCVLYMCLHQDAQQAVQEEIERVVGRNRPVNSGDRDKMPVTMATIYECLRLGGNALLGGAPRASLVETTVMGYRIPARTVMMVNLYSIHRNPGYFRDPLRFNPGRFIGEDGRVHLPPQYLHFLTGQRDCPGRFLAISWIFIFFANILQRLEVRPAKGTVPTTSEYLPGVSSRPAPYQIEVSARF